ncbi:MAG: hypothetical protein ACLPT4_04620 [Verrucomicrobiia bacterium]
MRGSRIPSGLRKRRFKPALRGQRSRIGWRTVPVVFGTAATWTMPVIIKSAAT